MKKPISKTPERLALIQQSKEYQEIQKLPKNKIGTEEIGLDAGTGTIAMVSDSDAISRAKQTAIDKACPASFG